jgi:hypothetical protein
MAARQGPCSGKVQAAPAAADVVVDLEDEDDELDEESDEEPDEELDELLSLVAPPSDELPEFPCGLLLVEL